MRVSMKKHAWQILTILLFVLMIAIGSKGTALADVNVGDAIDSSNWQKVQGLLPDALLEYVKKGWMTLKIGKLNYEPGDILSNEFKESLTKNAGKYVLNAKGQIVNAKTGELDPYDIIGIPFPVIDAKNDSQAAQKMQWNHMYTMHGRGPMSMSAYEWFVGKTVERYINGPNQTMPYVATSKAIAQQAQAKSLGKKIEASFIMKVTDPYELNGLATMSYWMTGGEADKVFAYVPALRRVRTLTGSARSDAMFGTDYALDDISGGFAGKASDFNCKILRTQDGLMRFNGPDMIPLVKNADGTYQLKKPYPQYTWGWKTPGWKGKPFVTTNQIWVKRKMHVFECTAKDPYYNYGKFELWYDPLSHCYAHKIIWDRAGKQWKVMNSGSASYKSDDGLIGKTDAAFGDWIYDEQRDHATAIDEFNSYNKKIWNAKLSVDDFTLTGLTKFAK